MGDPNASIPTPQPVYMRPMFGARPRVAGDGGGTCIACKFVYVIRAHLSGVLIYHHRSLTKSYPITHETLQLSLIWQWQMALASVFL